MTKRIFTYLAIAAVALSACRKEEPQQPGNPEEKPDPTELVEMKFEVSVEKNSLPAQATSTKTELNEDGSVLWSVGDKMRFIYEVDGTAGSAVSEALTAEDIKEDGSATITVEVPSAFSDDEFSGTRRLSAVYPSETTAAFERGELKVTVPAEQDGTFAHASISSADWSGSNSLVFKNVCGLLKMEVEDADAAKLVITTGETTVATLNVNGAGTYYAAVLPTTLEGFKSEVKNAAGETIARKSTSNALEVKAGHITTLGVISGFDDRFYVSVSGKGSKDGSSWDNAADLAGMKELVATNTEKNIYMAAGTYGVTEALVSDAAGTARFSVYGGYPDDATGNSLDRRAIETNMTILDGGNSTQIWEIGNGKLTLDGMTFQNAKKDGDGGAISVAGGSLNLNECIFTGTEASGFGGALHANGDGVKVQITKCTFSKTHAKRGGAISLQSAEIIADNCTFNQTYSTEHGGMAILNAESSILTLKNCKINGAYSETGNSGAINVSGGELIAEDTSFEACTLKSDNNSPVARINKWLSGTNDEGAPCKARFTNCTFVKNINPGTDWKYTAGCCAIGKAEVKFEGCTFDGNEAWRGAVLTTITSTATVEAKDCIFKNNKAGQNGGVYNNEQANASVTFTGCTFEKNQSADQGGVFYTDYASSNLHVTKCTFKENASGSNGGICSNYNKRDGAVWHFDGCLFESNTAPSRGLFNSNDETVFMLNNCVFHNNVMTKEWGILTHGAAIPCLNNCTVYNDADKPAMVIVNSDRGALCVNSTLICSAAASNEKSAIRVNNASGKIAVSNNVIIKRGGNMCRLEGGATIVSDHNAYGADWGDGEASATDVKVKDEATLGNGRFDSTKNAYIWDGFVDGFTPATKDDVIKAIEAFDMVSKSKNVGAEFKTWLESLPSKPLDRSYNRPGSVELN